MIEGSMGEISNCRGIGGRSTILKQLLMNLLLFKGTYQSTISVVDLKIRNSDTIFIASINSLLYCPHPQYCPHVSSGHKRFKPIVLINSLQTSNKVSETIVLCVVDVETTITASNTVVEAESDHSRQLSPEGVSAGSDDVVHIGYR